MTHYYCSTFSKGYAYRGLLLYNSLERWDKNFHFFMICLHDEVEELYQQMNLKKATIIPLSAIEKEDPQLLAVKETRNEQEYAWTSKASVMLYILDNFKEIDHLVWLDGDTYFFSDPEPIFEEWGRFSIVLTEERWNKANRKNINRYGIYNTGFMGFKRDEQARQCLNWFRDRLIEWCYVKSKNGLWSDQVYVNDWLERFANVGVIKNMGVNVTPPMVIDNKVTNDGNYVYINGERLIFFHYTKFRYYDGNEFELCSYIKNFSDPVIKWIYLPYIRACNDIMEQIRQVNQNFYQAISPKGQFIRNYFNLKANEKADKKAPNICTLLTKDYLIQGLALYYSLKRYTPRFQLWILCVDDIAYTLLEKMNLAHVTLVSLENIRNRRLARIERKRQIHEFCWTLKGIFVNYLLKNNYNLDSILYMDADLFFFKDVRELYNEWGEYSIFLTKLHLSPKWRQKRGKYSAGLIGFKRDNTGISCLRDWSRKCLNWCYDREEYGLWGDQIYLDKWPRFFPNIKISENKGINLGPWGIRKSSKIEVKDNVFYFNNQELVCYHFSGFKVINENEFVLCRYKKKTIKAENIYSLYVKEIRKIIAEIKSLDSNFMKKLVINQESVN
jgi:hypothetical protein